MEGIILYKDMLNILDRAIMIIKPVNTPKLKGRLFLNPYLVAFDIDIMVFGPGVKVVMRT